jgi:hypothetical protein
LKLSISFIVNPYKTQAAVLKVASFRERVKVIIPTLVKSKFFKTGIPTTQSPETDVNLAVRHKKIISSMLVLIPVIHENK